MASDQTMKVSDTELREQVRHDIRALASSELWEAATRLFTSLGYKSKRFAQPTTDDTPDAFLARLNADFTDTRSENEFRTEVETVRLLFQFTDSEVKKASGTGQDDLFGQSIEEADRGIVESFFFAVVQLKGKSYPRGKYATIAREINKRLPIATVVLMRNAEGNVTLAFVDRRKHKRHPDRAVLGNVALLREIDTTEPHRAHLDILSDLAIKKRLAWMNTNKPNAINFTGLLAAWLDVLNTEELNKRFYRSLYAWYQRAIKEATFPTEHEPVEEQVIRLITRLMFIWFIKEKGFVANELFNEVQVESLLKDYDHQSGDSYYRCILQNLFFGTLNTPVEDRRFAPPMGSDESERDTNDVFTLNFVDEIAQVDYLLESLHVSPFINGGLFECLDRLDENGELELLDGFIDDPDSKNPVSVPNRLFFDDQGLVTLFNRFRFTIEESTPFEQEVALDPELLGNVFESLLAAYVPETSSTKQAQTGTYYTPRQVVEYMVDEALTESLLTRGFGSEESRDADRDRLLALFDYGIDGTGPWSHKDAESLVGLIAETKVLDPAVGSGAFPMAALHKMTLALRKLDPDNKLWHDHQKRIAVARTEPAFDVEGQHDRDEILRDINLVFETYRTGDYGRKLFLIQNCMFGVDIQPIAAQIAKLRFFISLAIEQELDLRELNYGIRALPNLETRFVIADTLLPLTRWNQMTLGDTDGVTKHVEKLLANRERYFRAYDRWEKTQLRTTDANIRAELASMLRERGMPESDADRLAAWDPFDQSAVSEWFDPQFMFGVRDGFDVVIGNPPYAQLQKNRGELANRYEVVGFDTFERTGDLYQLFQEAGCKMLASSGVLSIITSNSWMRAKSGNLTRERLLNGVTLLKLVELGKGVFSNAIVDTNIMIIRAGATNVDTQAVDIERTGDGVFPPPDSRWVGLSRTDGDAWSSMSREESRVLGTILSAGPILGQWPVRINMGIKTGFNRAFVINNDTKSMLVNADPKCIDIIKPILRGKDIQRFSTQQCEWLINTHDGYSRQPAVSLEDYPSLVKYFDSFGTEFSDRNDQGRTPYNLRTCAYYDTFVDDKVFWKELSSRGSFVFVEEDMYCVNSAYVMSGESLRFLTGVLNSTLIAWFKGHIGINTGMGLSRWVKMVIERIPVPVPEDDCRRAIEDLVACVQSTKACDPSADTSGLEAELDRMVYEQYGLTSSDVEVVERSVDVVS